MINSIISDSDFENIRNLLRQHSGINLSDTKKSLVTSRLSKRLREIELSSYSEYINLLNNNTHRDEMQVAIDLLTTNETYFFRESPHFDFIENYIKTIINKGSIRIWSAACSSGQEAYTIAMILHEYLGKYSWHVVASDICTKSLCEAKRGIYPLSQASKIPSEYLKKYCLKGVDKFTGSFTVNPLIKKNIDFMHVNLVGEYNITQRFDFIFLRNIMIYFDLNTKKKVVNKLKTFLKPNGYLIIGHSESLMNISNDFHMVSPSIFRLK